MTLKCSALLEESVRLFSTAVAIDDDVPGADIGGEGVFLEVDGRPMTYVFGQGENRKPETCQEILNRIAYLPVVG